MSIHTLRIILNSSIASQHFHFIEVGRAMNALQQYTKVLSCFQAYLPSSFLYKVAFEVHKP